MDVANSLLSPREGRPRFKDACIVQARHTSSNSVTYYMSASRRSVGQAGVVKGAQVEQKYLSRSCGENERSIPSREAFMPQCSRQMCGLLAPDCHKQCKEVE